MVTPTHSEHEEGTKFTMPLLKLFFICPPPADDEGHHTTVLLADQIATNTEDRTVYIISSLAPQASTCARIMTALLGLTKTAEHSDALGVTDALIASDEAIIDYLAIDRGAEVLILIVDPRLIARLGERLIARLFKKGTSIPALRSGMGYMIYADPDWDMNITLVP